MCSSSGRRLAQTSEAQNRASMGPSAVGLAKITLILVFFCFAECAAGTCLKYGHSCWGAHGKRGASMNKAAMPPADKPLELSPNELTSDPRWFLSRLLDQSAKGHEIKSFPEMAEEEIRDSDLTDDVQDPAPLLDAMFPDLHRIPSDRLRFIKYLKNNGVRAN